MISVIGGAGFIGTRLCQSLAEKSQEFEILDVKRGRRFAKQSKITDIRDIEQLRRDLTGQAIVHLAAVLKWSCKFGQTVKEYSRVKREYQDDETTEVFGSV
jgi:nucleoside-diphosphate-sugar epimerase